jgi:signal-transduction protein with cAMP-binding, CBS, and nucleotidyltransferase domain
MFVKTGYGVRDVMTNKPIVIAPTATLVEAAKLMDYHNVNSLVVTQEKEAIGVVTDEDFVRKVIATGVDLKKKKVSDIMEKKVITIGSDKDIYDALILMRDNNIRQLPVVERKKMIGFLTMKDVLKIEPELFDIIAEKYELREEARKPITVVKSELDNI